MAVGMGSFFTAFQIPLLGTYASSDELSDKSKHEFFIRMVPPDRFQAQALIDMILYFNWTYFGLLYSEDSYGEHGSKLIHNLALEHDLCLAFEVKLQMKKSDKETDFVLDMLDTYSMVTVVIWFVDNDVMDRYLKGYEERNRHPKHIILSSENTEVSSRKYPHISR